MARVTGVGVRILPLQVLRDACEFGARLLHRGASRQSGNAAVTVNPAELKLLRTKADRNEKFALGSEREAECAGQHTDDSRRLSFDPQRGTEDRRISSETPLPK